MCIKQHCFSTVDPTQTVPPINNGNINHLLYIYVLLVITSIKYSRLLYLIPIFHFSSVLQMVSQVPVLQHTIRHVVRLGFVVAIQPLASVTLTAINEVTVVMTLLPPAHQVSVLE